MAEFLSPEWIDELDAAAAASSLRGPDGKLAIEQRVLDPPGMHGEVSYHMVVEPTGARVSPGTADAPDVTVTTDYETARALHEGRTTAQHALISGRYKVRGRLTALRVLDELDDVFAPVREQTTFPEAGRLRSDHDADG